MRMTRSSGILLHPTSLPGPYGIGDFGPAARNFIGCLAEAGQGIWQVLPLGTTGYGDSPYAPFSTFAGNELFLSPDLLAEEGLVERSELRDSPSFPADRVDYGKVIAWKRPFLDRAAGRFLAGASPERRRAFESFRKKEALWLEDYALFMAIKADYDGKARREGRAGARWNNYWPQNLALREGQSLREERERRAGAIERIEVLQFLFDEEWESLKLEANKAGILVLGDLPIFVAEDSADVWTHRELFLLDRQGRPTEVAGVPPDYFSADGQLWGNPLYDWNANKRTGFAWWRSRMKAALSRYDALRVDHFRGFESFWAVAAGEKTARNGHWRKAPGEALFAAIRKDLGPDMPVIAEDLGFITDEVRRLRDDFGLPGMRVLQFAFDAAESGTAFDPKNGFLPHNYVERCVVYTGTHDNDTLEGWVSHASKEEIAYLESYLGYNPVSHSWALVVEAWKSCAAWAIAPLQDILGLGSEARMNTPSTLGGNWTWRLGEDEFDSKTISRLSKLSRLYGRNLD